MSRNRGFTLVELLFVVAIIGIILALLSPGLVLVRKRALAIRCASQLRQIALSVASYSGSNDTVLPYVAMGPEASPHPKKWYQPSTGVPSLHYFLETRAGTEAGEARCPSDSGCAGQSFYPTPPGMSCYDGWGQSMLYNSSCYREPRGPGFVADGSGPLHGANPVRMDDVRQPSQYLLASDFWPHWHFGTMVASPSRPYYTNIVFFDCHVAGRSYTSQQEAFAYLNWDGIRRWWVSHPAPFSYSH